MIIGISGYARSGKDTIADILVGAGYQKAAFADKLRESLLALNPIVSFDTISFQPIRYREILTMVGYERAKTLYPEIRYLLQRLSTQVGRDLINKNIWVDLLMSDMDVSDNSDFVISDCRFPNEAEAIKAAGGQVWRVVRPGIEAANQHISEHALQGYEFDHVVFNDGTIEDLSSKVFNLINYDK